MLTLTAMSRFMIGNIFLFCSMACAVGSQLLIKALINDLQAESFGWQQLQQLLEGDRLLRASLAMLLLLAGFVLWILCLTKLELSYAYPVVCSSVLLVALLSGMFLGEAVTLRTWCATAIILIGLIILGSSHGGAKNGLM
jgi:drug/metabolite transporter (DMT)-like permease